MCRFCWARTSRVPTWNILGVECLSFAFLPCQSETPPLQFILESSSLAPLVEDEGIQARLLPLLPEGQRTVQDLREMIRSPQFQQSLRSLNSALGTDNVSSIFATLGLDPRDGADEMARGDSACFCFQSGGIVISHEGC